MPRPFFFTWNYDSTITCNHKVFRPRARSFSKGAVTFRARKPQMFKSKPVGKSVAQLLPHKPVNFASLTDCFKLPFSILLNWLWPWMQTWHTLNSSPSLKSCRHFRETGLLMVTMWYCPFLLLFNFLFEYYIAIVSKIFSGEMRKIKKLLQQIKLLISLETFDV